MSLSNSFFVNEQELCLNIIPTFANLIDYPSMKNALIPRIKSACLQTSSLAVSRILSDCSHTSQTLIQHQQLCFRAFSFFAVKVRVNSLVCLGKILEYLDKWFVIDEILPFLQQIPSREPAVLMGMLGKQTPLCICLSLRWEYRSSSASLGFFFRNLQVHL